MDPCLSELATPSSPAILRGLEPLTNYTPTPFNPKSYEVPKIITRTHELPRFGFPNNFGALLESNQEAAKEYIIGVCIGSIVIFLVALLWFIVIICLRIAGERRVGFLAGRLVIKGSNPSQTSNAYVTSHHACENVETLETTIDGGQSPAYNGAPTEESKSKQFSDADVTSSHDFGEVVILEAAIDGNQSPVVDGDSVDGDDLKNSDAVSTQMIDREFTNSSKKDHFTKKVIAVRAAFFISGVLVIVATTLFFSEGLVSFRSSLNDAHTGIDLVQTTANDAIDLSDAVIHAIAVLEEDLESAQLCDADGEKAEEIKEAYDLLVFYVKELNEMINNSASDFRNELRDLIAISEEVDDRLDSADIIFHILVAVVCVLELIILMMLVGVAYSAEGVDNCFTKLVRNLVIWPLFIFFLFLSWVFATLFLLLALAGADFCMRPDDYVTQVLNINENKFDSAVFELIIFYISGCTVVPSHIEEILEMSDQMWLVLHSSHELSYLFLNQSIEEIQDICDLKAPAAIALKSTSRLVHDASHVLNLSIADLLDILSCKSFNPIYTTFVHDALCIEGVNGLSWIFSTTLMASICSMMMIMFRAALYPIEILSLGNQT